MDVKPRKTPRQARSKATVDAIVEATTQVLLQGGYDKFTTARAAERAGVSVGSLYQYFPNKAALASAVVDRCCESFLVAFEAAVAGRHRTTLAECIRAIVDFTLVSHHLTPQLHGIVVELAPRIGVAQRTRMVSQAATRLIESMLRRHLDEIEAGVDIATAALLIETLLEALAHRMALQTPAARPDEALAVEATRLITRYLAPGDSGSRS